MAALSELKGCKFGSLTVIERAANRGTRVFWRCLCECGKETEAQAAHLKRGARTTCGCRSGSKTHGASRHSLYPTWNLMMARCYNSKHVYYHRYGGRGILVQPTWHSFPSFLEDIHRLLGEKPEGMQLDRVDNMRGYYADNVRWVTRVENGRNREDNTIVIYNGVRMTLPEAAERSGILYSTLVSRLKAGWTNETLFKPIRKDSRHANFE